MAMVQDPRARRRSPWLLPSVVHLIGPLPALYARAVPVDRQYPNLERLHASPDIYIIKDFLTDHECTELQAEASRRGLSQSPSSTADGRRTSERPYDCSQSDPAVWIALLPELSSQGKPTAQIALEAVGTWLGSVALFGVLLLGWAKWREVNLQALRTSTSVRLDASVVCACVRGEGQAAALVAFGIDL